MEDIYFQNNDEKIKLIVSNELFDENTKWKLYFNDDILLQSNKLKTHLNIWKEPLDLIIDPTKVLRVLIVGGGNQFLSNYLLNFPCNITILDPYCFDYLQSPFKEVLFTKDFVNTKGSYDNLPRKLVLLDQTLTEAYEDGTVKDNEFDLILMDNYLDNFYYKSGMYTLDIPPIYFNILKDKAFLLANNRFYFKKMSKKTLLEYSSDMISMFRENNKYYKQYLNKMNSLLCETDLILKNDQRISVYCKTYVDS